MNRLKALSALGQSVWLDFLSREFVESGALARQIASDGLGGMTSNPSIFEKAIAQGKEYDADIARFVAAGMDVGEIFHRLSVSDIEKATDVFRPVYDVTKGADGFVSIEVSPYIAADTDATIAEARGLWKEIARPNVMIKVPGTPAGIPAIRTLIGEGININITLLFSRQAYAKVAQAYIEGLEARPAGEDLSRIASVASFFVSRIDTKADAALEARIAAATGAARATLEALRGKIAVANAKLAYQQYKQFFSGPRWSALAARGARPQRLLWASTGTKNKAYSDVLYVDELIAADSVNTMPRETMDAFRDHGTAKLTIEDDVEGAAAALAAFEAAGLSLDAITDELVDEGVALFADAADKLYAALADKRTQLLGRAALGVGEIFTATHSEAIGQEIASWARGGKIRRLWARDKALWTNDDEDGWLGWLDIAAREAADTTALGEFTQAVKTAKRQDVALFGMGGSGLGAQVLAKCLGTPGATPRFHLLDSTDPDQIAALDAALDLRTALFIVSSKSGTTLEPKLFTDYFADRIVRAGGAKYLGQHFAAVTDPGSALEAEAKKDGFAHLFYGDPAIGGRYSVLSKFGLAPAAAIGIDVKRLLAEARIMAASCHALSPASSNPGVRLGAALGVLARDFGRDKITIVSSARFSSVGAWLEQLIAESTGKTGKGLIPVDLEPLASPDVYGNDRVFVQVTDGGESEAGLKALAEAGHPVIRIALNDPYQIAQLFFLWEMAIAVAGSIIGINPFNQPDVEAAKVQARALTKRYEETGALPAEQPFARFGDVAIYADAKNAGALGSPKTLPEALKAFLAQLKAGDYFALLAFIEQNRAHEDALGAMRIAVRDAKKVATCAGFGPRFQHSTGQAYKGGPNTGVFLQITADPKRDLTAPRHDYSFAVVEAAEAQGDAAVLAERGRRIIRIHLKDADSGLAALKAALDEALK
jgi:transaldolase / glucose-6-phosphate isomerase